CLQTHSSGRQIKPTCFRSAAFMYHRSRTSRLLGFKKALRGCRSGLGIRCAVLTRHVWHQNGTIRLGCAAPRLQPRTPGHDRAQKLAEICQRRPACQRRGSITITPLVIMSGRPTITKKQRNTTRPRSTRRLRTTHTWLTDTINTQFNTTPKLRNCMLSSATAWRRPLPSKAPRRRVPLKKVHFAASADGEGGCL